MPVAFLTDDHLARYGRYAGDPTPERYLLSSTGLALFALVTLGAPPSVSLALAGAALLSLALLNGE